jgi:hypothetical protein
MLNKNECTLDMDDEMDALETPRTFLIVWIDKNHFYSTGKDDKAGRSAVCLFSTGAVKWHVMRGQRVIGHFFNCYKQQNCKKTNQRATTGIIHYPKLIIHYTALLQHLHYHYACNDTGCRTGHKAKTFYRQPS